MVDATTTDRPTDPRTFGGSVAACPEPTTTERTFEEFLIYVGASMDVTMPRP
jgi:hypothetical protein